MGEASVSQLQIWDHALPSLVTRVGWYAGLPEGTVAWVRPDHEIADIRSHLSAFLADPMRYALVGEQGRRLLETRHTPEAYAQALVDLVGQGEAFRPNAIAHDMARRVGSEMRLWTNLPDSDVTSYLWGQVVGLHASEPRNRQAIASLNYRHMDALKCMRQTLSDRVQQLQRQLSLGLQALRRAASEELFTPPQSQPVRAQSLSNEGDSARTPPAASSRAVLGASSVAPGGELR
jgi:hypothetical protein